MNFFKRIVEAVKKAFGFSKQWYTRLGLGKFLDKYIPVALQVITQLAAVNNNRAFHEWKDEAFQELKKATGEVKDNYIAILLGVAFELFKGASSPDSERERI